MAFHYLTFCILIFSVFNIIQALPALSIFHCSYGETFDIAWGCVRHDQHRDEELPVLQSAIHIVGKRDNCTDLGVLGERSLSVKEFVNSLKLVFNGRYAYNPSPITFAANLRFYGLVYDKIMTDINTEPLSIVSFTVGAVRFTLQCATGNMSWEGTYFIEP